MKRVIVDVDFDAFFDASLPREEQLSKVDDYVAQVSGVIV